MNLIGSNWRLDKPALAEFTSRVREALKVRDTLSENYIETGNQLVKRLLIGLWKNTAKDKSKNNMLRSCCSQISQLELCSRECSQTELVHVFQTTGFGGKPEVRG